MYSDVFYVSKAHALTLASFPDSESCSVKLSLPCPLQKEYTPFNIQNMFPRGGRLEEKKKKRMIVKKY
jgi:hypothetical protein